MPDDADIRMPGPVSTAGEFIDIVLLLNPWRCMDLLPKGELANSQMVQEVVFSVDTYTGLPNEPGSAIQFAAQGNADELGDYVQYAVGNVRLVSDRFRKLLEEFGQRDVQFFPAEIETGPSINSSSLKHGGGPVVKFWWMHHWRRHDLVDAGRSVITYARHLPPLPKEQSHFDVDRCESLILRSPPLGEGLYGIKRWPRYRIATPALAARIREAGLRVSLHPRALSPEAKARFMTGLRNELDYFPEPDL